MDNLDRTYIWLVSLVKLSNNSACTIHLKKSWYTYHNSLHCKNLLETFWLILSVMVLKSHSHDNIASKYTSSSYDLNLSLNLFADHYILLILNPLRYKMSRCHVWFCRPDIRRETCWIGHIFHYNWTENINGWTHQTNYEEKCYDITWCKYKQTNKCEYINIKMFNSNYLSIHKDTYHTI